MLKSASAQRNRCDSFCLNTQINKGITVLIFGTAQILDKKNKEKTVYLELLLVSSSPQSRAQHYEGD